MNTPNSGILTSTKYANAPAMLATSEGVTQEVSAPMRDKSIPNSKTESIPYGYCHCGCGEKTEISPKTFRKYGWVKGEPRQYRLGHAARKRTDKPIWSDEQGCYEIPLFCGETALVDADSIDLVNGFLWHRNARGYASSNAGLLHRVVMNASSGEVVDHINGDKLDNRLDNLRICTQSQNAVNQTKRRAGKSSPYIGVSWSNSRSKWVAQYSHNKQTIPIGRFPCPIEAAIARDVAVLEIRGEFAHLNFPELRDLFKEASK